MGHKPYGRIRLVIGTDSTISASVHLAPLRSSVSCPLQRPRVRSPTEAEASESVEAVEDGGIDGGE